MRTGTPAALTSALLALVACGEPEVLHETEPQDDAAAVETDVAPGLAPDAPVQATPPIVEPEPPVPAWLGPPYPIVLVHGFSGFSDLGPLDYFYGVIDAFADHGTLAFAPAQPPYASVAERAVALRAHVDAVREETGRGKVHLFCHSQGGLDCRYVASLLNPDDAIASVVTIATPHHGTPLADLAAVAPDGLLNPAGLFLGWMLGLLEGPPSDEIWADDENTEADFAPELAAAVADMTTDGAAVLNAAVPDHPDVPVFSVAAVSSLRSPGEVCDDGLLFDPPDTVDALDVLLTMPALMIGGLELRRNDGIVPTDSMKWGTFLGCIPADHFDEVGQIADQGPGLISGFDHLAFYETLLGFVRVLESAPSSSP